MYTHRNPADLLGLGTDPALIRLLRACGADEAYITGNTSDYDTFSALATAMPLCEGHPLRGEVNTKLTKATGVALPLCPHTVKTHWDGFVEGYLYGETVSSTPFATVCPLCSFVAPEIYRESELTALPNPVSVSAPDLASWSTAMEKRLPDSAPALFRLPDDYAFVRPDPYHAGLAVGKVFRGEALTKAEADLLIPQALRVWGMALSCCGEDTPALFLRGGAPSAVLSLLAYLETSHALPPMVWIPYEPALAETVSGLYSCVRTGYAVADTDTAEKAEEKKRVYAAVAPVGRAIVLVE